MQLLNSKSNFSYLHILRIFVLVLSPFLFGAFILPHTQMITDDRSLNPVSVSNVSGPSYSIPHDYQDVLNESAALAKISSIFPLSNYLSFPPFVSDKNAQLCFQDKGSRLNYPNGSLYSNDFFWDIVFNKNTDVLLLPNSVSCTPLNFNENFTVSWHARIPISTNNVTELQSLQFASNGTSYYQFVLDYGILQGLIMIPACYLLIFYPAAGIIRKIQKGLIEQ